MITLSENQIGLAVKSVRLASKWAAKDIAEKIGISASALSKIESGKQVLSFAQAYTICSALGIRTDHLALLAHDIEPIANPTASLREQLRHDLRVLQQQAIKTAVAVASKGTKSVE